MTTNEQWRSTTGLRTALVWLLATDIAATAATGIALAHRDEVFDRYAQGSATHAAAQASSRVLGGFVIAWALVYVATAVVFIVWTWRGTKNNELLARVRPRYTSGWSIGGWFIPIANLWIPVRVVLDLWQGSDPAVSGNADWRRLPRPGLVHWWWGLFLMSRLFTVTPIGLVSTAAAAVLAILVVRRITDRQEALRHSSRPSGWYADPMGRFDHRFWNGSAWTVHASQGGTLTVDPLD
jgi:hypothetical protein